MTRSHALARLAALAMFTSLAAPAWAQGVLVPGAPPEVPPETPQERGKFGLSGEVVVEFQNDNNIDSDDPDAELSDTFNTTEAALELTINRFLSAHSSLTFEPVLDPDPGDDRFFEDEGLYAEELYAKLALGDSGVEVFGGKFNPAFGVAWDKAPGIYGVDFAEDYEITERIGFGAGLSRDAGKLGKATLTGSTYYADTTELSRSLFTDRGRTRVSDGGVSNTEELDSYAVALDLEEMPMLGGASAHFAYRFQHQGETLDDLDDEHGYAAGLYGSRSMNGVGFEWVGEVVYLDGAEGTLDELWYYTLGGVVTFAGRYNIAVSYTGRPRDIAGGGDFEDKLLQVSAGVELHNGWTLDAGYKYHVEENVDNHTVGFLLAKSFNFDTRRR